MSAVDRDTKGYLIILNPSFLPKITDYFDYGAIDHWASLLHKMSSEALSNCVGDLGDAVTEHTRVLSDELLQRVAFVIADDLYKTANTINLWSDSVETYLRATAGVFFDLLDQRGFRLHYVIDNSFEDMERPLRFFPTWYSACGIAYECPQLLTAQDGTSPSEARRRCTAALHASGGNFHYAILDTDSEDDSFTAPREQLKQDKVITVIRIEAPIPGSKTIVYFSGREFDATTLK